jgi:hypothetical protein
MRKAQFTLGPDKSGKHKTSTLARFLPKSVQHGDERGSLADLYMVHTTTTEVLAYFHPTLRGHFYMKGDSANEAELVDKTDLLTTRRYPQIESVKWNHEQTGCEFSIHRGVTSLVLTECEVDDFKLSFQEGAIVVVEYRVRARPTSDQAGILYDLIMNELDVSLTASAQEELDV